MKSHIMVEGSHQLVSLFWRSFLNHSSRVAQILPGVYYIYIFCGCVLILLLTLSTQVSFICEYFCRSHTVRTSTYVEYEVSRCLSKKFSRTFQDRIKKYTHNFSLLKQYPLLCGVFSSARVGTLLGSVGCYTTYSEMCDLSVEVFGAQRVVPCLMFYVSKAIFPSV